jgi:hypothetical protein
VVITAKRARFLWNAVGVIDPKIWFEINIYAFSVITISKLLRVLPRMMINVELFILREIFFVFQCWRYKNVSEPQICRTLKKI